ncbi:zinc finger protein 70-like isoform X1 [Periophthalmus magnuspinnatus]|uniref:zinc finger protein 70-like isoform X1 n=1 Tax=Periophthalmus magnuspinnatus TaxID=409849 RepID=UPI0024373E4F|nr:zinc finger protein 70-like isoform X1 [Periophthalmus magnuspinnatus]
MSCASSGEVEVRHVQKITEDEDNGASRKSTGGHGIISEPYLEETLLDYEESDCAFVDLASDPSVSCLARVEKYICDETIDDVQKTKVKRKRRLPKRYRSNDDETDSDREKKEEKEWKPNQKITQRSSTGKKQRLIKVGHELLQSPASEKKEETQIKPDQSKGQRSLKKKHLIKLRIGLMEKCPDTALSNNAFMLKGPVQTILCQQNLSEPDFFNHLRSTFPELGEDEPLEAVLLERNKTSVSHPVSRVTQSELYRAFRNAQKHLAFYIQPKELEDTCDTATSSHGHKPSTSVQDRMTAAPPFSHSGLQEQSETQGPSKLSDEQDGLSFIASAAQSEEGEDDDDDWNPAQNEQNEEHSTSSKIKKIRKKRVTQLSLDSCKVCGLTFQSIKILTKHALCHLDNPKSICGVCGQELESSEELKSHLDTHQKLHQCDKCGRYFLTFIVFQKHKITCELGETAAADGNMWKKINVHQKEKPSYKCDYCPQIFRIKTQLYIHKKIHTDGKPYSCDVCGKCFSNYSNLHRHKLIHSGEKKHSCTHCGKFFYSKYFLNKHEIIHLDRERNFLCDICSKTFYTNSLLISHQKIHDESHIIKCPVCGKLLKGELQEHMRIHTGEKPYTCKLCGVKFRLRNHLRNHMNSHLGIKPFTCTVCGCKTSRKAHLEMHMRTHTGHKPYKCTLCDKAYTQAHCLKTHMKSHQAAVDALA